AVAKIMSNKDLVLAAAKIRVVTRCRNTMGERGVLGIRLQPNHPADDLGGILLSTLDGLLYGCGDAVIGVNPATDSVETVSSILHALHRLIEAYKIPTQACCLAHVSTQLAALDRGAPIDLLFQSVAGTEAANRSFGVTLSVLREGRERVFERFTAEARRRGEKQVTGNRSQVTGAERQKPLSRELTRRNANQTQNQKARVKGQQPNVMYFETGQGSALSAEAHHGVDQLTLEARAYGVARVFEPFLVNSVVGFIGP